MRQGPYPMSPPQYPATAKPSSSKTDAKTGDNKSTAAKDTSNVDMQPEAYQRTLEYVQQCQSWSNNGDFNAMSPDSSSVKGGAKPKTSPAAGGSETMPPPAAPAAAAPAAGTAANNM